MIYAFIVDCYVQRVVKIISRQCHLHILLIKIVFYKEKYYLDYSTIPNSINGRYHKAPT